MSDQGYPSHRRSAPFHTCVGFTEAGWPERGEEAFKLLRTARYKRRMLEAFAALITKRRETHVRQLEKGATAAAPPLGDVSPRLRVEPCPTYFLRTARAYSFLQKFLEERVGKEELAKLHGLTMGLDVCATFHMGIPPAVLREMDENIRKYEEIGTHPAANHNAVAAAVTFHRGIGAERKATRLRYLRDRWARPLLEQQRVRVLTPLDDPEQACGIALVNIEGLDTMKLQAWLMEKHRIVTTPIVHAEFNGLRITPNVYTTLDEIDLFVDRVTSAIRRGLV